MLILWFHTRFISPAVFLMSSDSKTSCILVFITIPAMFAKEDLFEIQIPYTPFLCHSYISFNLLILHLVMIPRKNIVVTQGEIKQSLIVLFKQDIGQTCLDILFIILLELLIEIGPV